MFIASPVDIITPTAPNLSATQELLSANLFVDKTLAMLESGDVCPTPNMPWPENISPIAFPEDSGLTGCFVFKTEDHDRPTGTLYVKFGDAENDDYDRVQSYQKLLKAMGVPADKIEDAASYIKVRGAIVVSGEVYAPGGSIIEMEFVEGNTEIRTGFLEVLDHQTISIFDVITAFSELKTISKAELDEIIATLEASQVAVPTATPTRKPKAPTKTPSSESSATDDDTSHDTSLGLEPGHKSSPLVTYGFLALVLGALGYVALEQLGGKKS